MNTNDLARWIVEHGADKPAEYHEVGVPLYLPLPDINVPRKPETDYEVNYEVDLT